MRTLLHSACALAVLAGSGCRSAERTPEVDDIRLELAGAGGPAGAAIPDEDIRDDLALRQRILERYRDEHPDARELSESEVMRRFLQHIADTTPAPSEGEVRAGYEANRAAYGERPYGEVRSLLLRKLTLHSHRDAIEAYGKR